MQPGKQKFEIEVEFDPETGEIEAQAIGIKGEACSAIMQDILDGLGDVVVDEKTAEFYQKAVQKQALKTGTK